MHAIPSSVDIAIMLQTYLKNIRNSAHKGPNWSSFSLFVFFALKLQMVSKSLPGHPPEPQNEPKCIPRPQKLGKFDQRVRKAAQKLQESKVKNIQQLSNSTGQPKRTNIKLESSTNPVRVILFKLQTPQKHVHNRHSIKYCVIWQSI